MTTRLFVASALILSTLACTCNGVTAPPAPPRGEAEADEGDQRPRGRRHKRGGSEAPDEEVEMPAGVEYLGDDRWRVQRKVVDTYIEHSERLGCNAREKGAGYELFGVNPTDDAFALGARNKDLVLTINGKSLSDPADLINVYLALADAKVLTVVLERQGERRTHVYEIEG